MLPDGLYRVTEPYLCAGFFIEGGKVLFCAPILRKRLSYWMKKAVRIEEGKAKACPLSVLIPPGNSCEGR